MNTTSNPNSALSAHLGRASVGTALALLGMGANALAAQTSYLARHLNSPDQLCIRACALADIDNDGRYDLALGAPGAEGGRGTVLFVGSSTGNVLGTIQAPNYIRGLGSSFATVPDVDEDGIDELVVGAFSHLDDANIVSGPAANAHGLYRGSALIISVGHQSILTELHAADDWIGFGSKVCGVPDCDADGIADIVIGVPQGIGPSIGENNRAGIALLKGGSGSQICRLTPPGGLLSGFGATLTPFVGGPLGASPLEVLVSSAGRLEPGGCTIFNLASHAVRVSAPTPPISGQYAGTWAARAVPDLDGDSVSDFILIDVTLRAPQKARLRAVKSSDLSTLWTHDLGTCNWHLGQPTIEYVRSQAGAGWGSIIISRPHFAGIEMFDRDGNFVMRHELMSNSGAPAIDWIGSTVVVLPNTASNTDALFVSGPVLSDQTSSTIGTPAIATPRGNIGWIIDLSSGGGAVELNLHIP